jgi:hypothetical protein
MKKKNSPALSRQNQSGNTRNKAGFPTPRSRQFKHVAASTYFQVEESMVANIFDLLAMLLSFLKNITRYRLLIPEQQAQPALLALDELLTDKRINDAELRTLLFIHNLTARHDYNLPPVQLTALAHLRQVSSRTIARHLSYLQKLNLIRATPLDKRDLVILGDKLVISLTHEHAVVHKDMFSSFNESFINNNIHEEQQHVQHATADKVAELKNELATIFIQDGEEANKALSFAAKLINLHGYNVCLKQLGHLNRRCEIFRENGGMRSTPSGVLVASIKANWSAPAAADQPVEKAWYTPDEFNQLIEH